MKLKNITRTIKAAKAGNAVRKRMSSGTVNGFVLKEVGGKFNIYAVTPHGPDKLIGRYTDRHRAEQAYNMLSSAGDDIS